eukprot:15443232-Alexandrium_andersonii.AAC.1
MRGDVPEGLDRLRRRTSLTRLGRGARCCGGRGRPPDACKEGAELVHAVHAQFFKQVVDDCRVAPQPRNTGSQ